MKTLWRSMILAAAVGTAILEAGIQPASAAQPKPILYGTTGACNNEFPGGPCSQTSELVQIDPSTGALIKDIGPVGYTVNGLAWDSKSKKLYASTAIGDVAFHGLITIDPKTGAGTPVNPAAPNFGLAGDESPIHSITIDFFGRMVAWYDEKPGPGITDTFVQINKRTGVATEFPNTGINTNQNGLSFSDFNLLWNIDTPRQQGTGAPLTQTAYLLNPFDGKVLLSRPLCNPPTSTCQPTMAALGDFNPVNNLYYGLKFDPFTENPTFIVVVNLLKGTVTTLGQTVDHLHTLAFAK